MASADHNAAVARATGAQIPPSEPPVPPATSARPTWPLILVGALLGAGVVGGGVYAATRPDSAEVAADVQGPTNTNAPPLEGPSTMTPPAESQNTDSSDTDSSETDSSETDSPETGGDNAAAMTETAEETGMSNGSAASREAADMQALGAPPSAMATTMGASAATKRAPRSNRIMAECGPNNHEHEMFIIRRGRTIVRAASASTNHNLNSGAFRTRVNSKVDEFSSCYYNHPLVRGQWVYLELNAAGRVSSARMQHYCPIPRQVEQCILRVARSLDFSDMEHRAGEVQFTLTLGNP